ncbi:hypothetical protein B296_00057241 [Ensete ventricosum]|uniref:Transmembrane protein n=1 Tax=Ensete ventricosum TaxID=4639 RepID=A0A426X972_ENSVE|nr:hypothetical protein B296_00057241 [Ensete ventricosum]
MTRSTPLTEWHFGKQGSADGVLSVPSPLSSLPLLFVLLPKRSSFFLFRSFFWRDFRVLRGPNLAVILSTAGGRSVSPFSANFLGLCFGKISLCVVAAGVVMKLVGSSTVMHCEKFKAQPPIAFASTSRSIDALLQDYAYRAFVRPRTGIPYNGTVPPNLTGIKIAAIRLRSGSLRKRGVNSFKEFSIPVGVVVQPYVRRLVLVYQNLGNWSSIYYPLPGYHYLTPVLGLLAYDAANLSATNLPELSIVVLESPISINFTNVAPVPSGTIARCVWFGLDGSPYFRDLVSSNVCSTYRQGHFSIVINSSEIAPSPAPSVTPRPRPSPGGFKSSNKSKVWKIVVGVVGGFVALVFLALLVYCVQRYKQNKKVEQMEQHANAGVSLQTASVGDARVPVASVTRTQPVLENELVA